MTRDELIALRKQALVALKGYYVATLDAATCVMIEPVQVQAAQALHSACGLELLSPDTSSMAKVLQWCLPPLLQKLRAYPAKDEAAAELLLDVQHTLEGLLMTAAETEAAWPGQPKEEDR